jgi:NitT/TauT family transport system substrate-binding protein
MKSHRPLRLLGGLLVGALALTAVAAPAVAKTTTQASTETTTVRLGVFANVTHAPGLVAIEGGFLQDALGKDVKLEVTYFNAGPAVITALLADAIDVSYIGPNPSITGFAQTNGEALRILSGSTSGGASLVVKPTITKVSDLKGKKIATPQLGNTQDVAARSYLKSKGLSTDVTGGGDVSIVPTANATTLTAFQQGNIDGAWVPEPWASRLVNEAGGKVLVDEATLWPEGKFVTTQLIGATDFIKNNPKTISKILKANLDAVDFANSNPTQAQKFVATGILTATNQKVDPATIANSWANLTFTVDPLAATLAKSAKDAENVGLLDKVNLKGIYDLKPLNKLLKAEGKPVVSDKLDAAAATKTTTKTTKATS